MPLINQISIPRFDSLLSKILGLKERVVAPSVGTELLPTFPVQDPAASEIYFTKGEQLLWLNDVPFMWGASVAAIHPVIALGNPLGSGKLITIEHIHYEPAPDIANYNALIKLDWSIVGQHGPGFGGVGVGFPAILNAADWNEDFIGVWRDTRWWPVPNTGGNLGHALRYFAANKLAAGVSGGGSVTWHGSCGINSASGIVSPFKWDGECVLAPGAALVFRCTFRQTLNQSIKFDMMWRERPLEDSELRPGAS